MNGRRESVKQKPSWAWDKLRNLFMQETKQTKVRENVIRDDQVWLKYQKANLFLFTSTNQFDTKCLFSL